MDLTPHGAEIGYVLNRKFWGQGLAPEAAQALLELAFQHLDLKYIQAYQLTSNPQSARVLEKIGLNVLGLYQTIYLQPLGCSIPTFG